MSRTLTASDRRSLIRLASTMDKGSEGRRAILAGLKIALRKNLRQVLAWYRLTGKYPMNFKKNTLEAVHPFIVGDRALTPEGEAQSEKTVLWKAHQNLISSGWKTQGVERINRTMGGRQPEIAYTKGGDTIFLAMRGGDGRVYFEDGLMGYITVDKPVSKSVLAEVRKKAELRKAERDAYLRNRRQRFSHKTAGRNDKRLAAALLKYLGEIQDESQDRMDGDPKWGRGGKYDPVADVGVWVGPEVARYSDSGADVVLHYDGAGYDVFSDSGDYAHMGFRKYREHVEKLGAKYKYHVEPLNNYSLGFFYEGR